MRNNTQDLFLLGFDGGDYAWNPEDDERQARRQNQTSPHAYSQPNSTPTNYGTLRLQSADSPQTNEMSNDYSLIGQLKNAPVGTWQDLASKAVESFENGYYPSESDLNALCINRDTARKIMEGMMNRSITRDGAYQILIKSGIGNPSGYVPSASGNVNTPSALNQSATHNQGVGYSPITGNIPSYSSQSTSLSETAPKTQNGTNTAVSTMNQLSESENRITKDNPIDNAVDSFMNGFYPSNKDLYTLGITMDNARKLMQEVMNRNISRENLYDIFTRTTNLSNPLPANTQTNVSSISNLDFRATENERPTVEQYRHVQGTDASGGGVTGAGPLSTSGVQNTIRGLANGTRTVESLTPGEIQQIGYNLTHGIPTVDQNVLQQARESVQAWANSTVTRVRNTDMGLKMRAAFYNAGGKTYNGEPWPVLDKYKEYYTVMTPEERSKAIAILDNDVKLGEYIISLNLDERIEKKEFDPGTFFYGVLSRAGAYSMNAVFSTVYAIENTVFELFFPGISENTLAKDLKEYSKNYIESTQEAFAENAASGGFLAKLINRYGPSIIEEIPLFFVTYGAGTSGIFSASMDTNALMQQINPSHISIARNVVEQLVKSPKFLYSIAYSYGGYYERAIEEGLSKIEATEYAFSCSILNAIIDYGTETGNSDNSMVGSIIDAGIGGVAHGITERASEYRFFREGDVFDVFSLRAIWGDFLDGTIEEGLTQSVKVVSSTVWNAIDTASMYDLSPNGTPLDTWEEFKQKYASSLSKFDEAKQMEAYRYYLTDMTTVRYNGERMNFMRFLNEKLMESSGNTDLRTVETAFKNLFESQYRRRTRSR